MLLELFNVAESLNGVRNSRSYLSHAESLKSFFSYLETRSIESTWEIDEALRKTG